MAQQQYWVGSFGPYLYDDTRTYPDGKPLQGFRGQMVTPGGTTYTTVNVTESVEASYPIGSVFNGPPSVYSPGSSLYLGFGTWDYVGTETVDGTDYYIWTRTA